jgi:uncharacterized membrane protein (UPF0182 family)
MTRKFTEKSYSYIQTWLKNKYSNDPEFKRKANENTSFCYLRNKVKNLVHATTIDAIVDLYTKPLSKPIIINYC